MPSTPGTSPAAKRTFRTRHGWHSWPRTGSCGHPSCLPNRSGELRDLTRARQTAVRDRTRQSQRLEKFLESSGIKLSAVVSELMGASSRAILDALVAGERDPAVLADLARGTLRRRIPELLEALRGRFADHHAFMVRQYLAQIDAHEAMVDALTARIEHQIAPFRAARDALVTIPGISTTAAEVIIAETGADMDHQRGQERRYYVGAGVSARR